ncbi:Miro domain-containing protein [Nostoc linckia NIES-25]|nr:Miro domain-containing protein [Nostoc linckia NIES-25]
MTNEKLLQIIEQAAKDKVRELDLSGKDLTTLPAEIGRLTNLRELYLNSNLLTTLPVEISQLSNLTVLALSSNQLTMLPVEIVQLSNLTVLNLSSNQLTMLPIEIGQLSNLTILNLSSNQLKTLPQQIGQLFKLTVLDLSSNQLKTLPQQIGQLSKLTVLDLSSNQLKNLPQEIGQLLNLNVLNLRSNQPLKTLLAKIGQLSNLRELDLSSNQLTTLPPEISQICNLTLLDLNSNQLKTLPAEIGQLSNLRELYLNSNQLITLPPEIGQLSNLNQLKLQFNKLTTLPAEIGQLSNLSQLFLLYNELITLPAEIGQLSNLTQLDLKSNQLTTLPAEIGQLSNLTVLDLRFNRLTTLPAEIGQLSNLTVLDLQFNQLTTLPPEILNKGVTEILNFYRQQLEQETDRIYEAKLLIVGEGGAGKTTLAKKIQDQKYALLQDESTTEGINVIQWKFLLDNNREFQVNIWDFGGQEIYHATHQFFLTKRSLYTLVADTRKEDTDFYYWLNVVELLSDNSPLLIVKNEKQERKREINERELRREFTNFKETLTTNLATDRGLPEILNKIKHYITNLPHVGVELPKTWVKVREALERDSHEYISLEEYLNICQKHGFTKQEDKLQLSSYLHDLGVCLHFQDDDLLRKTVILKPTWGTDAVYKVLDNPQVIEKLGKFDRNDLKNIWHENKYANMRPELLRLMMKFKLCYEIPSRPGTYIAPQLLSANQPDFNWDESNNLILRYKYDFMPKGILTRFIVEMHSDIEQQTLVWKTGVVLAKEETRAEVIEYYYQREIKIRVAGKRKKELLTVITHEMEKIHNSYERLQYQTLVPCNCDKCKDSQTPYSFPLNELYEFRDAGDYQIQCRKGRLVVDVRRLIDDVFLTSHNPQILMSEPIVINQVFISYSHQDQQWLTKLQKHLKPMIRNQTFVAWDDSKIQPGAKWREEIEKALAAAKVAVLLVSPDFLASDFIADNELPPLLDAAEAEGLTIIWIPLTYSSYEETEIEKYQSAHPPNQPLNSLNSAQENRAWVDICKKIKAAIVG